jgi:multiple sugar transport system permease protein
VTPTRRAVVRYLLLVPATLLSLFPVYWMVNTAFQPPAEWLATPPVLLTTEPTLDNFASLFGYASQGPYGFDNTAPGPLFNSLVVAGTATILSVSFGTFASWSISRFRIGGNQLPLSMLAPRMFPPIAVAVPLLIMYTTFGLVNTRVGLIVAYTGFTIPFSVWMTKSFVDEIPVELEEAGMMDGLTRFQTFYRVTLPLMRPGIAATTLFVFILNWGEFLIALTLTRSLDTAPVLLSKLFSPSVGSLFGPQAALGVISVLPMILLGYLIYEHLARGFTFGAIHK